MAGLGALAAALGCGSSAATGTSGGQTTTTAGSGGAGTGTGTGGSGGAGTGGAQPTPMFVAVGYGGRRIRSTDGAMSWTDDQSLAKGGGDDMALLRTVVAGDGQVVALGWRVMTSTDGKSWTDHGAVIGQWIGAAAYAKGQYVAVGGYGLRATSSDGVTWKDHSIDTSATHAHDALVYAEVQGGRFVSANDDGKRSWSADGTTWAWGTGADGIKTTHLAYGNGVFVGIDGGTVVTSNDGAAWTVAATLSAPPGGVVFAKGHFTALADGHVFTSIDGGIWADYPAADVKAGAIIFGQEAYLTLTWESWRRSDDGLTWEAAMSEGPDNSLEWATSVSLP